jgi:membrane protein implicated in regulation of membrane protease activity
MSKLQETLDLLERAERAAIGGNFASADELLKGAATIQENELGPAHPDLASTLTNLAIVAEKTGRAAEAEKLYRRAERIAAAALPADHPMVRESRQNLEDFCRAHGVQIDVPAPPQPVVAPQPPDPPSPAPVAPLPPPPATPSAAKTSNASHSMAWLAAAILLVAIVLLLWRPWSSRETPTQVNAPQPKTEPLAAAPRPAAAPPDNTATARKETPRPASPDRGRQATPPKAPAPGNITLAVAEVCRSFSTSGSNWRCDPVGSSVKPGPMVLYTRVKSPRDTTVVHRWYNGKTLRQSVKLNIRGNATEGYRTYSRQTVSDGEWRVEVRSADDALLHEQRFIVR